MTVQAPCSEPCRRPAPRHNHFNPIIARARGNLSIRHKLAMFALPRLAIFVNDRPSHLFSAQQEAL
jgi:hypothetical protein